MFFDQDRRDAADTCHRYHAYGRRLRTQVEAGGERPAPPRKGVEGRTGRAICATCAMIEAGTTTRGCSSTRLSRDVAAWIASSPSAPSYMPGIHKGSGWLTYAAGARPTRMKMTPRAHARPGRPWTPPRTQFRDMAAPPVGRWKQCPDARSGRPPCQEADSADR